MNTWNFQINQIKSKLSRSCGLLTKLRYYFKSNLLKTVYFAIFDSILRYGIQTWGQHRSQAIKEIEKIQEKDIRIVSLKDRTEARNPLFKKLEIMKMNDILPIASTFCYIIKEMENYQILLLNILQ